ncbi:MAG: hypothetical protein LBT00_11925 [Spirochaetaceae bacterium]|jgi:hypothetical protein|nr:hypothetical protein [Spirochaetaceae bacterium]
MKKNIGFVVLGVALLFNSCASASKKSNGVNNRENMSFIEKQLVSLEQLCTLHKEIQDIDKSLEKLGPVAVVENGFYFVFDLDQAGEKYEFRMEYPVEMELPQSVRATFPLGFYGNKSAAVITEDAFETLEGRITIFHEFVHCFQSEEGSWELKMTLDSAREAYENQNYQWELNHPFPYTSEIFIIKTEELDNDYNIGAYHKEMKAALSEKDFEYMIWQEWTEGYATYIENLIRERLGVHTINIPLTLQGYATYLENLARETGVTIDPIHSFDRSVFYEIGNRYIAALIQNDAMLKGDIKTLFQKMINCEI